MEKAKGFGIVLGFIIVAIMSYVIGTTLATFEVSEVSKNSRQLNEFYEEKMVLVAALTEEVSDLELQIEELEELQNSMIEAIELGDEIESGDGIEGLEVKLAELEAANVMALEEKEADINARLKDIQEQVAVTLEEVNRMQGQLEAWGN